MVPTMKLVALDRSTCTPATFHSSRYSPKSTIPAKPPVTTNRTTCVVRLKSGRTSSDAESGSGATIEGSLTGSPGTIRQASAGQLDRDQLDLILTLRRRVGHRIAGFPPGQGLGQ